jgi:hypothetical protein
VRAVEISGYRGATERYKLIAVGRLLAVTNVGEASAEVKNSGIAGLSSSDQQHGWYPLQRKRL